MMSWISFCYNLGRDNSSTASFFFLITGRLYDTAHIRNPFFVTIFDVNYMFQGVILGLATAEKTRLEKTIDVIRPVQI